MEKGKKALMVLPVMKGGGAERVASLLLNQLYSNGFECEYLLTSSCVEDAIRRDLLPEIPLNSVFSCKKKHGLKGLFYSALRLISSLLCKPFEKMKKSVPANFAYLSFVSHYYDQISAIRKKLKADPELRVIAFLQPSIPIVLIAAKGLPNKIIISERGDPKRQLSARYGYSFIKKYYSRADKVVFQTNDAKAVYPKNVSKKGTVIFNPINDKLPKPYFGERENFVTTFCRISYQKNLIMLVEAFGDFHKRFVDYRLKIIGGTQNCDDEKALAEIKKRIDELNIADYIDFLPFSKEVHKEIMTDAMYVNSSDYEGMSNAMLEAMAIGMPVICTDCPIGGAAAVIKNGENGILVEVGNISELSSAMKRIAIDKDFSNKISLNAAKIRDEQSLSNITKKWMELL